MSVALVTGASGFIGGHLVERILHRGDRVRCLVRKQSKLGHLSSADAELAYGDVLDADQVAAAVRGAGVVYHLAGVTRAFHAATMYRVNGHGTENLLRACAAQRPTPRVVLVSSLAAAGPSSARHVRTEAAAAKPVSVYGRSKRAGEVAAERWAHQVPVSVVRPGIVFGPRNRELLPAFQSIERWGLHVSPGLSPPRVTLIHVSDLLDIVLRAADHGTRLPPRSDDRTPPGSGYYFAGDVQQPTYQQLGRMICEALGRRTALLMQLPEILCWIAAGAAEVVARIQGYPHPFNVDKMRGGDGSFVALQRARRPRGTRLPARRAPGGPVAGDGPLVPPARLAVRNRKSRILYLKKFHVSMIRTIRTERFRPASSALLCLHPYRPVQPNHLAVQHRILDDVSGQPCKLGGIPQAARENRLGNE